MKKIITFFISSCIGTILDFSLYALITTLLSPAIAHPISYTCGMLCNFTLQKRFVFAQTRRTHTAFLISLGLWILGLIGSTILIYTLNTPPYFERDVIVIKLITIITTFWYNYFCRKFAFGDKN